MDSWGDGSVFGPWNQVIENDCWLSALLQGHGDSAKPPKSGRNLYGYNSAKNVMITWPVTVASRSRSLQLIIIYSPLRLLRKSLQATQLVERSNHLRLLCVPVPSPPVPSPAEADRRNQRAKCADQSSWVTLNEASPSL